MPQYRQYASIAIAVLIGVFLQLLLIAADSRRTPGDAAIAFSKSYFMLDPSMADWLCEERKTIDDVDVVDHYLYQVTERTRKRGFDSGYMKNKLYHIKTHTLREDEKTAEVRITGLRRFAMNPLYATVGQIFGFTTAHEVDEVLTLVKEGNRWKICGKAFQLPTEL